MCRRDPEAVAHARESAEWGEFEVVVRRDGEELGRLNETFDNDYDAHQAAQNAQIPDVGIEAGVERIDS